MSKIAEIKINNFSGGISDDPREPSSSKYQTAKHFDVFSQPNRMIPYRSLEADTNDGSTSTGMKQYAVRDFLYHSSSAKLFGLSQTGAGLTKIVYKADATTGNWTLPGTSEGNGAVQYGCLVEYKDILWGFQGTNQIWKWTIATTTISNSASTTGSTITSVAQGLIFNDYLYLPYNNKIWRATDATTFSDAYLTLPTNFKITSLTAYGRYIAIGCAPVSTYNGTSKVFLWDGTSTEVQESIDWGEGELRVLESIEGILVGVTDRYLNNSTGAGKGSMIVQTYETNSPTVVKEVFTQALTGKTIPLSKAVKNNRLFWSAKIMTNSAGTEYNEGIWSFGRKNVNYPFALNLDIEDSSLNNGGNVSSSGIQAFGTAGNYFFIAHSGDGSIDKTNDASTYAFTSTYESQIFNFGDPSIRKQLHGFSLYTAPIPTSGSVTVKYKVDADTSWTTIGTLSTVGETSRDFMAIESTGADFATGKEFQFRIESVTGGAEVTGFKIKALFLNEPNG
jgi:hypothetical protein